MTGALRQARSDPGGLELFRAPPAARIAAGTPDHLRLAITLTCRRPELRPLCPGMLLAVDPALAAPFQVEAGQRIALHPASLADPSAAALILRHALEVALRQRLGGPAGTLHASRVAAFYAHGLPADERRRALAALPSPLATTYERALAVDLPALAAPSEHLLTQGGGSRLQLAPTSALNRYGCPARPHPGALAFASSTASTISAPAYRAVEATRQFLLRAELEGRLAPALADEARAVKDDLLATLEVADLGAEAILLPSGTDGEYAALQIARRRNGERLVNIVVAPEETGSGVLEAARGRHFAPATPHGERVPEGEPLAGLDPATIAVETVEIRAADGATRPLSAIDAEVVALAERAIAAGARCLVHLLDASKTGLAAPSRGALGRLAARHGERLAVVVDACQLRLERASLRADLARGWMVLLTGSKFMMGPAFSGALLLPPGLATEIAGREPLPAGFGRYFARPEWPDTWHPLTAALPERPNLGLLLRWRAALWEMQALQSVPERLGRRITAELGAAIDGTLRTTPLLEPLADAGGELRTIFPFRVLQEGRPASPEAARQIWRWLREDLSDLLPSAAPAAERRLAGFACHVGQPVRIGAAGALRLCIGAHLITQVAFDPALGRTFDQRLRRQIGNARIVLEKAALIARYFDRLALRPAPPD